MKRKILILSVLAICIATLAAGTLAYFTSEGKAHNVITTGGVEIAVQEWADMEKTRPFENLTGVMPNATVTKIAEVKNTGASDAWVRVAKKLDQIELAELLNVSHGYISRIESGKKGCSVDLLIQLSEIFGTSLDYLILGKCHDVLDAAHLKENIQHLIEDLEHFQAKL